MTETMQVQGNGHPHKKREKDTQPLEEETKGKKNQISLISIRYFTNTKTQMCGKHALDISLQKTHYTQICVCVWVGVWVSA